MLILKDLEAAISLDIPLSQKRRRAD